MVIFHSYVSLPEGMLDVSQMGDAGKAVEQFHTQRFSFSWLC